MKIRTVTIGIPAHNEGANIAHLLADVLRQDLGKLVIKEIIVVSDGSTDDTSDLAKIFNDNRIQIFTYKDRKGKAFRQNQIIKRASGDVLVLLDADIALTDITFIQKLVSPIMKRKAAMTSAAIRELFPRTFFEDVLDVSMKIKNILFSTFNGGDNVYMCHGPARAFTRPLFEQIRFTADAGEDMYSYFACVSRGYTFAFVPDAVAHYRLPSTYADHTRQSMRYLHAKQLIRNEFGDELFYKEMHIPLYVYFLSLIKTFPIILRHPVRFAYYVTVLGSVMMLSKMNPGQKETWQVTTSKILRA